MTFGLLTQEQHEIDDLGRLVEITVPFTGHRVGGVAESHDRRAGEHDEEAAECSLTCRPRRRRLWCCHLRPRGRLRRRLGNRLRLLETATAVGHLEGLVRIGRCHPREPST